MAQDGLRQLDYLWVPAAPVIPTGTVLPGTLITPVPFTDVILDGVEIYIPNGPAGQVGVQLQMSGGVLLPFGANPAGSVGYVFAASDWIIADGDRLWYDLGIEVDKTVQIVSYNSGTFPHTIQWRFKTHQIPPPPANPGTLTIVPIVQAAAS